MPRQIIVTKVEDTKGVIRNLKWKDK